MVACSLTCCSQRPCRPFLGCKDSSVPRLRNARCGSGSSRCGHEDGGAAARTPSGDTAQSLVSVEDDELSEKENSGV